MRSAFGRTATVLTASVLLACEGVGPVTPEHQAILVFSEDVADLGSARTATVALQNVGERAVGPVEITPGAVLDGGGGSVPGSLLRIEPSVVATLNPGREVVLTLEVEIGGTLQPGTYGVHVDARAGTDASASLDVTFRVDASDIEAVTLEMGPVPATLRQGDVTALVATARDAGGTPLQGSPITWAVDPPEAGFVGSGGAFVGYRPGPARIVARAGSAADTAEVSIRARALPGSLTLVGTGPERARYTSDLWVHGAYAYLGTWGVRDGTPGNTLFTWSVADPAGPLLVDSLRVDARIVNDVKVHPTRPLAVITHELSEDAKNGVTFLDLTDPAHPRPISRFTRGLESGIHNAWLDGDYAYLVVDGVGSGLRVLDISDPVHPRPVGSWVAGTSFLHDVFVRDGLAFLCHWDAGLAILDVGNGIAGGAPERPALVSILPDLGGQTHNAWYWPDAGYVFVGEEDFKTPGRLHVVDVRDLRAPREVATFDIPGQTPHNVWLDESRGILYAAWYGQGIRALDVSGELLGDLSRQGREIVGLRYNGGPAGCPGGTTTCTWAPQLQDGLLYLSDLDAGLVVFRPDF